MRGLLNRWARGSFFSTLVSAFLVVPSLALLQACGGGGGGSAANSNVITITKSVSTLTGSAAYLQGTYQDSAAVVSTEVSGTVSPVPTGSIYPEITLNGQGFVAANTTVTVNGDGSYNAVFKPDTSLQPGTYPGTITLALYKDAALTQAYTVVGGTLPFAVTITPMLSGSIFDNGIQAGSAFTPQTFGGQTIGIASGDIVEIETNIPTQWSWPNYSNEGQVAPMQDSTLTAWRAIITKPVSGTPVAFLTGTAQDGSGQTLLAVVNIN